MKCLKVFFENLQLPDPHYNLNVGSGSHCHQLGEKVKKLEEVLLKENPKVVLVYGDTNSTLAGALAAVKHKKLKLGRQNCLRTIKHLGSLS